MKDKLKKLGIAFEASEKYYTACPKCSSDRNKDNSKTLRHWQFFNCFIEEKSTGYNYVKINRNDFYKAKYSYFKKFLMS